MENLDYKQGHNWLIDTLSNCSFKIPVWIQDRMDKEGIGLIEIYQTLRGGSVGFLSDDYGGVSFEISGRNCDDECIKVWGWVDPMSNLLEINAIAKS